MSAPPETMMKSKSCLALVSAALALTACHQESADPADRGAAQEVVAPPVTPPPSAIATPPTPSHSGAVSVTPEATPCGAEKLQNYLNLLPTSTAKDEIARTLGHNRVRYISLEQEKADANPTSSRVSAGIGVDGRIKEFGCG
jgi:hypothetical protein